MKMRMGFSGASSVGINKAEWNECLTVNVALIVATMTEMSHIAFKLAMQEISTRWKCYCTGILVVNLVLRKKKMGLLRYRYFFWDETFCLPTRKVLNDADSYFEIFWRMLRSWAFEWCYVYAANYTQSKLSVFNLDLADLQTRRSISVLQHDICMGQALNREPWRNPGRTQLWIRYARALRRVCVPTLFPTALPSHDNDYQCNQRFLWNIETRKWHFPFTSNASLPFQSSYVVIYMCWSTALSQGGIGWCVRDCWRGLSDGLHKLGLGNIFS